MNHKYESDSGVRWDWLNMNMTTVNGPFPIRWNEANNTLQFKRDSVWIDTTGHYDANNAYRRYVHSKVDNILLGEER